MPSEKDCTTASFRFVHLFKKKHPVLLGLIFFILLSLFPVQSSDLPASNNFTTTSWCQFRNDAKNTGFTTASIPIGLERSSLLSVSTRHSPLVGKPFYYLLEEGTGMVHCYDCFTHALQWKNQYSQAADPFLSFGNVIAYSSQMQQLIFLETVKGDWKTKTGFVSRVYGIDPIQGTILWQNDLEGYYANSITVDGSYAWIKMISIIADENEYVGWLETDYFSNEHCIVCLNLATGAIRWKTENLIGGEICYYQNPVAVHETYLVDTASINYIPHEESSGYYTQIAPCYVLLLDKETGLLLCTEVIPDFVGISCPLLHENSVYINAVSLQHPTLSLPNCLFHFTIRRDSLHLDPVTTLSQENHILIYRVNFASQGELLYYLDYRGVLLAWSMKEQKVVWKKFVGIGSLINPYLCTPSYLIVCTLVQESDSHTASPQQIQKIKLLYIHPQTGNELYCHTSPYEGNGPIELSGTDNSIWVLCRGNKLLTYVPPVAVTLSIEPKRIDETVLESQRRIVVYPLAITSTGHIAGTITPNQPWIQIDPTELTEETTTVKVTLNSLLLSAGDFVGEVLFSTNAGNIAIPIFLTIHSPPCLVVEPSTIITDIVVGQTKRITLSLRNTGGNGMQGDITSDQFWIHPNIDSYNDSIETVSVLLDTTDLKAGVYRGTLFFHGNEKHIEIPITIRCIVWITFQIGSRIITVNQENSILEPPPYLFESRTFIPIRKLVETFPLVTYRKNTIILWNQDEGKVTIQNETSILYLWIENPIAQMDGESVPIDPENSLIVPQIREGRTCLPLRFIAEYLGYRVEWDSPQQKIHVTWYPSE